MYVNIHDTHMYTWPGPAQDALLALILWYVAKNHLFIVGIGPIRDKDI